MEFLILFILSLIPRLIFLFYGMPSITHDEADYFLNSYFLAKTGSDFWNNKFFLTSGLLSATSAIPIYINSIAYTFLNKSIFISRLIFTLLNIFTPILFYYIIKKLTKNKLYSFLAFLTINFSPWFTYLSSQINFESVLSLFFYTLSLFVLLSESNKYFKYLIFIITLFLSFNSYMGIKASLIFLIFINLLIYGFYKNQLSIKYLLKISFFSVVIYIFLFALSYILPNNLLIKNRAKSDLILLNKNYIENKVWYERLTTDSPEILKKVTSNKITVITNHLINNFFYSINPVILFLKSDPHPIYGNNLYGLFYLWQIIFFIYGLIKINNLPNIKKIFPLITIIFFGSIPTMISIFEPTIALRALPIILPYSLIIANGIFQFINEFKKNKYLINIFFLIFIFSFLIFFIKFNTRIKILSSEQWHLGEKKLFEKVLNEKSNKKIFIVNNEPKETFMLFSFYHINDAFLIKNKLQKNDYTYKNLVFTDKKITELKNGVILIKRGTQNVDKLVENKLIFYQPYLEASDKSGVLYYEL